MYRQLLVALGVCLVLLWICEIATRFYAISTEPAAFPAPVWITWLDLLAALCAFGVAVAMRPEASARARAFAPSLLAVGLFVLWAIGFSTPVPVWVMGWNFAFGCAFLWLGIGVGIGRQRPSLEMPGTEREQGAFDEAPYVGVGPRAYRRPDLLITEEIIDRLTDEGQVDATEIEVTVTNGEVRLWGAVPSEKQSEMAAEIAAEVRGVRRVENQLLVVPGRRETPREVA